MILVNSKLYIADNSGATGAQCIKVLKKKRQIANIGTIIVITIKSARVNRKVKKGEVRKALVIRQAFPLRRLDGSFVQFFKNSVVILQNNFNPLANRVKGPIVKELRNEKFLKILCLCPIII